jgi:hypothetical protein
VIYYQNSEIALQFNKPEKNDLITGHVLFTQIGEELRKICVVKPIEGFYDYIVEKWRKAGLVRTESANEQANPKVLEDNT